jgi:hypothetical protein
MGLRRGHGYFDVMTRLLTASDGVKMGMDLKTWMGCRAEKVIPKA